MYDSCDNLISIVSVDAHLTFCSGGIYLLLHQFLVYSEIFFFYFKFMLDFHLALPLHNILKKMIKALVNVDLAKSLKYKCWMNVS